MTAKLDPVTQAIVDKAMARNRELEKVRNNAPDAGMTEEEKIEYQQRLDETKALEMDIIPYATENEVIDNNLIVEPIRNQRVLSAEETKQYNARIRAFRANMLKKLMKVYALHELFSAEQAARDTKFNLPEMRAYLEHESAIRGSRVQRHGVGFILVSIFEL